MRACTGAETFSADINDELKYHHRPSDGHEMVHSVHFIVIEISWCALGEESKEINLRLCDHIVGGPYFRWISSALLVCVRRRDRRVYVYNATHSKCILDMHIGRVPRGARGKFICTQILLIKLELKCCIQKVQANGCMRAFVGHSVGSPMIYRRTIVSCAHARHKQYWKWLYLIIFSFCLNLQ